MNSFLMHVGECVQRLQLGSFAVQVELLCISGGFPVSLPCCNPLSHPKLCPRKGTWDPRPYFCQLLEKCPRINTVCTILNISSWLIFLAILQCLRIPEKLNSHRENPKENTSMKSTDRGKERVHDLPSSHSSSVEKLLAEFFF